MASVSPVFGFFGQQQIPQFCHDFASLQQANCSRYDTVGMIWSYDSAQVIHPQRDEKNLIFFQSLKVVNIAWISSGSRKLTHQYQKGAQTQNQQAPNSFQNSAHVKKVSFGFGMPM